MIDVKLDISSVKLIDNMVLLEKPIIKDEQTESGLLLPGNRTDRSFTGTVVVTGPGRYGDNGTLIPMNVSIGDEVIYVRSGETEFKQDNVEYVLIPESSILIIK